MLDKDTLYRLYVVENKTTEEIAKIANVSQGKTVKGWLRGYNIPLRKEPFIPSMSREMLYDLYINERMTTGEISQLVNKSPATIGNWLRKYGIPLRDVREAQRAVKLSKEELYELYVTQHISIDAIARQVGSSEISIHKMLNEYDIPIRDRAEHLGGWNKGMPLPKRQRDRLSEIAKERVGKKHPRYGAELTPVTRNKIANSLKGRFRKHLHPNWKDGGITKYRMILQGQFEYKEWRKAVYERDNYTCQMCNKPSNGDIQAHHIHPVKDCPERILDITNGITLCESCHHTIHFKEDKYIAQFEAIVHSHPPTP